MKDRIFTIENKESKGHRTFRIMHQAHEAGFAPGAIIVGLLTGSSADKPSNFTNFAFVQKGKVKVWKSKISANGEGKAFVQYARLIQRLALDEIFDDRLNLLDAIVCRRCGGLLTRPDSIRAGIGPYCARKETGEN